MRLSVEELAVLYNKILDGTSTIDDVLEFQITIGTSCIDREMLIPEIEKKAAELRRKK